VTDDRRATCPAGHRAAAHLVGVPRAVVTVAAVVVVVVGVAAKLAVPGTAGDLLGSVLYTVLLALLVRLVAPRLPCAVVAGVATAASIGVELLQLTGLPGAVSAAFPPVAWALGTTFAATDLLGYALGGAWALVLLTVLHRAS